MDSIKVGYENLIRSADSCFSNVIQLSSKSYLGYLWRARSLSILDPESLTDSAKIMYDKVYSMVQDTNEGNRYNKVIIECYRYFGSYYFFKSDREKKADPTLSASDKNTAKGYFEKILQIDPADEQAKTVILALNSNK